MADLMEIIKGRRSIRKYDERDVPEELVDRLLEAVRWAPSWTNCQCWEVVVVRDQAVKEQLQASLPPKGNPAVKAIVDAPVLLAMCARTGISGYYKDLQTTKFGDWMMYDLGLATQNLCLMAHHLGLGTVIVGLFDHDRAAAAVNVPAGHELVTLIPLGYPAKVGGAPKRREPHEFTHDNHF
ncbi:nitroreductase [Desulfosarcina alkanivorans]|uniref:Nitroreductase n=1 Tax=Desulfosarcina alkanivorans TaxID=571177 RepID=A0A5K7YE18_9BACT|nr:nitroreductase family protein [Desulfosarcina alkanivorans]BBO67752.1 nitroreductase [Desulfosarcina alkanivorans]